MQNTKAQKGGKTKIYFGDSKQLNLSSDFKNNCLLDNNRDIYKMFIALIQHGHEKLDWTDNPVSEWWRITAQSAEDKYIKLGNLYKTRQISGKNDKGRLFSKIKVCKSCPLVHLWDRALHISNLNDEAYCTG